MRARHVCAQLPVSCISPNPLTHPGSRPCPALTQDLDWRFAAAQEEMAKAAASADEGDATPSAAAETKPSTA